MANYRKFENKDSVYVEQNIYDNNELESYDADMDINGINKKTMLYYFNGRDNERCYTLGCFSLLESLDLKKNTSIIFVKNDLSEVFKYKTANTRRKYIYEIIRKHELSIN